MNIATAATLANAAAEAVYDEAHGPPAFCWLDCFEPGKRQQTTLGAFVLTKLYPSGRDLYDFATRGAWPKATPFLETPLALQLACDAFVGVMRALDARIAEDDIEIPPRRPARVVPFR